MMMMTMTLMIISVGGVVRSVAGDSHAHQNPGLLALSVVWLRYHNAMATQLQAQHPTWNDERLFHAARRRVIAVLQVYLYRLTCHTVV